jgi:predicted lipoprotein
MKISALLAVALTVALPLSSCKLIKTSELKKEAAATGQAGDADRIAALIGASFEAKLVPLLSEKAVDLQTLKTAVTASLDNAGKTYGLRVGGSGGSWNFAVKGSAKILEIDRHSKAGIAKLDMDGDGKPDADLQIGPVVRGSALRDIAPFYDFSAFRDQIEFAKLGRELNDTAVKRLPENFDGLSGKMINFVGAVAIRSASELPMIVPVTVEATP